MLVEKRDAGCFDSDATFLLVLSCVGISCSTGVFLSNDTVVTDESVSHSGFTVVDVRDYRNIYNIGWILHLLVKICIGDFRLWNFLIKISNLN